MKRFGARLGLAAVVCASPALAGTYVGAGGLSASRDYPDLDRSTGYKLNIGHRFAAQPLMLELQYIDAGEATADPLPGADSGFQFGLATYQLSAGYFLEVTPQGSGYWLKGGYYDGDAKLIVPRGSLPDQPDAHGSIEESTSGALLGVGGVWKPSRAFGLRAEIETLFGAKDFAEDKDVTVLSLAAVFEFGQRAATPALRSAYATPPLAPAQGYAAEPPRRQDRVVADAMVDGQRIMLQRPSSLYDSPQRSARATALPAGTEVAVKSRLDNRDGAWWFVSTGSSIGWLVSPDGDDTHGGSR